MAANQTVIIDAIDAITAVNAAAMKRADVLDFDWTEKRVKSVEEQLLIGLEISQAERQQQHDPSEAEDRLLSTVIPVAAPAEPHRHEIPDTIATDPATVEGVPLPTRVNDDGSGQARDDDDNDNNDGWGGF
jgi:hypothetical protein